MTYRQLPVFPGLPAVPFMALCKRALINKYRLMKEELLCGVVLSPGSWRRWAVPLSFHYSLFSLDLFLKLSYCMFVIVLLACLCTMCMCICVPYACLESAEEEKVCKILWNWSCSWLWAPIVDAWGGTQGPLEEQPVFLTTWSHLSKLPSKVFY